MTALATVPEEAHDDLIGAAQQRGEVAPHGRTRRNKVSGGNLDTILAATGKSAASPEVSS
jgi:hypothetical protein